jgi:hypothetical protein
MADQRQAFRSIRNLHLSFLALPFLLIAVLTRIQPSQQGQPSLMPMVLGVLAVSEIGIATVFRARLLPEAAEKLRTSPGDAQALGRWQQGNILSFTFATTIVLYGFVLRVLGFCWNIAAWFFVAGFLLLLWWTPRLENSTRSEGH